MAENIMPQHQYGSSSRSHPQSWEPNGLPVGYNQYTSSPTSSGLYGDENSYPVNQQRSLLVSSANTQAFGYNNALPMASPMIAQETDYHGGFPRPFACAGILDGQQTAVKSEAVDCTDSSSWALPMRPFLQPVGSAEGSDFDTGTATHSPRSGYFSDSDEEHDLDFSPQAAGLGDASASNSYEYPSTPTAIKQSGSQSNSPDFHHLPLAYGAGEVGIGASSLPSTTYGVGSTLAQGHNTGLAPRIGQCWSPLQSTSYTQMQQPALVRMPYYQQHFVGSSPQYSHSFGAVAREEVSTQDVDQTQAAQRAYTSNDRIARSAEQSQREKENKILMEGKAAGKTYKEIQLELGTHLKESTLRGRYRAMIKHRRERVRKPVWTPTDIHLLEEVVSQQLDSMAGSSYRGDQRLSKVSWKKVGEYIKANGGSYKFGNSTCKKKYVELHELR